MRASSKSLNEDMLAFAADEASLALPAVETLLPLLLLLLFLLGVSAQDKVALDVVEEEADAAAAAAGILGWLKTAVAGVSIKMTPLLG